MPDAHAAAHGNVAAHRNIVYATAERFGPPVRVTSERVVASAVQCPQVPGLLEQAMGTGSVTMNEDCLTLNVFAPTSAASNAPTALPVLVWIHGGAFTNGTANASWYDGSNLAARGCVVVTINYRLGAFGFTGADDVGLLDQLAALQWVRDNAARFGGDPDNVTIFGESAGGCSVLALMAAPAAEQLFHRAWAMSPSIGQLRTTERAAQSQQLLLKELQVTSLHEAKKSSVDDVLAAQGRLLRDPKDIVTMFSPTIGGAVLPADAHTRIHRDQRPLVIGTLRDESRLWVALNPAAANFTEADARVHYDQRFGADAERAWKAYSELRPGSTPAQMLAALQSDESFRAPAWRVIDGRDAAGTPTWSYFFTWPTPVFGGVLGACHGLDIPFVFDNIAVPGVEMFIGDSRAHRPIADALAGALVQFAHSGAAPWHHTDGKRTTMQIDERSEVLVDPERSLYDVWNR
ncbi:MAG: carboxylesterase/lipase family protein [Actinobacteria bacterium]|nr:carboxylesterase/lipase family protein [Actinomycetota bacterium]